MPLYEYRCTSCEKLTDIRHGFDDVNSEACPACGGALTKSFNVSGIVFKGSGFYVNDSRGSGGGSNTSGGGASTAASNETSKAAPTPSGDSAPAATAPVQNSTPPAA